MARLRFKGTEEYMLRLQKLEGHTREVCGKAIYDGAGIVAHAVKVAIYELPTDEHYGTQSNPSHGPNAIQKAGLIHSFGITPMQDEMGEYNVKLGFDGYNILKTKGWPGGQPNQMIARAIESGTSFSDKIPFVSPAVRKSKTAALKQMEETLNKEIEKAMKG